MQVLLGIVIMVTLVTIAVAVLGILMQILRRRPVHRWALIGGFAVLLIIAAGIAGGVIGNDVVAFIAVICVFGAGWYFDRRKRERWRELRETADERAAIRRVEKEHKVSNRETERQQRKAEERRRREQREAEEAELRKQKQAEKERRAAAKRVEREQREAEEATRAPGRQNFAEEMSRVEDTVHAPALEIAGEVEALPKKLREPAQQNMSDDESIEFHILGTNSQAIVALKDRLLVIKPGWMAEAAFGARVTSFYYRDINGIKVSTGLMMGVIEINTPSYQGTQEKDYWSYKNKDRDPHKVSNCLPISKTDLKRYKPLIDRLSTMIKAAKQENIIQSPAQDSSSLSAEIEKLASLRELSTLSEDEFQQAKKRLLDQ